MDHGVGLQGHCDRRDGWRAAGDDYRLATIVIAAMDWRLLVMRFIHNLVRYWKLNPVKAAQPVAPIAVDWKMLLPQSIKIAYRKPPSN
jgi:hypothetical protein